VKQFLLIDRDFDGCLTLNELLAGTLNAEQGNNQEIIRDTFKSLTSFFPNKITFTGMHYYSVFEEINSSIIIIKYAFLL